MNGIDRRGQKVICIYHMELCDRKGTVYLGQVPVAGEIYTVADFAPSHMEIEGQPGDAAHPGIVLAEVRSLVRPKDGRECGWPILLFRPVNERRTDIAELRKLANPTPAKQTEPA